MNMRVLVRAAALLVLLGLAMPVLRFWQQDVEPLIEPGSGAVVEASSSLVRSRWLAAQQQAVPQDPLLVRDQAARLLREGPLHGSAYRALALLAEQGGETDRALTLNQAVLRLDPRNELARAWLVDHAAATRDWPAAVEHIDGMLRTARAGSAALHQALAVAAAAEEGRAALLFRLGEHAPPWRAGFLRFIAREAPLPLLESLYSPLRIAPVPLSMAEREGWIERLVREGQGLGAYYLWLESLGEAERAVLGNIHDGGFERSPSDAGFGWRFGRVSGASISRQPVAGSEGSVSLLVDFHGQRVAFQHVRQRLALVSGDYTLSGRVFADGLQNERGLQWQLRCEGGAGLAETERFSGQSGWRRFEVGFSVPAEGCSTQWLALVLAARIPAERLASGRIWFDALRISRQQVDMPADALDVAGHPGRG